MTDAPYTFGEALVPDRFDELLAGRLEIHGARWMSAADTVRVG